jgi:hypothetical protein
MLSGMQQPSLLTRLTRPVGQSGAAALLAGAAMGAVAGARVACSLSSWLPGAYGCVPGGFPAGALAGALLALVALPLLGREPDRGSPPPTARRRPRPPQPD